ncbi:MAG: hypothetical protein PVF63_05215 [Gammaproteobacteria bacterium]
MSGVDGSTALRGESAYVLTEMSLRERSALVDVDNRLHEQWRLGQNVLLCWCPEPRGLAVLVVPHYAVAEYAAGKGSAERESGSSVDSMDFRHASEDFFKSLLSRNRMLTPAQIDKVSRLLGIDITHIALRYPLSRDPRHLRIVENMIKRYGISYVPNRAVALFDIVGFSLLSPFEQMNQINSLAYSLNSAQSKLLTKKIDVNFSRSTTGDGFYIWNRDLSLEANVNLYQFMHLVLADNAIARSKARGRTAPRLRACFHIGSCYEFHQAEGLNPTTYDYIVGDVTIELARMVDRALPGQVLVGEFNADLPNPSSGKSASIRLSSIEFIGCAEQSLSKLEGLELSGDRVDAIKCYLTGSKLGDGKFAIRRIVVNDKHGMTRRVYNAKVNIYRRNAQPILLGIEDHVLDSGSVSAATPGAQLAPAVT